jgi:hypothetical protein
LFPEIDWPGRRLSVTAALGMAWNTRTMERNNTAGEMEEVGSLLFIFFKGKHPPALQRRHKVKKLVL